MDPVNQSGIFGKLQSPKVTYLTKKVEEFPHVIREVEELSAAQRSLVYAGRENTLAITPPPATQPERGVELMNHL